MKKIMILIIIITLLLVSSVSAITQTQLENQDNSDIKDFLLDNLIKHKPYYDKPSNNYIFSYTFKTIIKNDNEYVYQYKELSHNLDRDIWTSCRNHYSYSQCYNLLVNSNQEYSMKTLLINDLRSEYKQIIYWRDHPTIDETINEIGGVTI